MPDKIEIGQRIEVSDGLNGLSMRNRLEHLQVARAAFEESAKMLNRAQRDLWDNFYEIFPDLRGFDIRIEEENSKLVAVVTGLMTGLRR